MKLGTKTLLFGVHQFAWHPLTVLRAWIYLYGWPNWRELVCILIHDWGYWGCSNMDGTEGMEHPRVGARLAGWLFGPKYEDLVLWHSRYLARQQGREPSRLCWADKLSMEFEPRWFYLLRARLTGELQEYRANAAARGFLVRSAPDEAWHRLLTRTLHGLAICHAALEAQQAGRRGRIRFLQREWEWLRPCRPQEGYDPGSVWLTNWFTPHRGELVLANQLFLLEWKRPR